MTSPKVALGHRACPDPWVPTRVQVLPHPRVPLRIQACPHPRVPTGVAANPTPLTSLPSSPAETRSLWRGECPCSLHTLGGTITLLPSRLRALPLDLWSLGPLARGHPLA